MEKKKNKKNRKKKCKKLAASLLAVLIATSTLAGCAKSENKPKESQSGDTSSSPASDDMPEEQVNAKGRYIETQIDMPEGFDGRGTFRRLKDGSLSAIDTINGALYNSADEGKTWDQKDLDKLFDIVNAGSSDITSVALAEGGGVFFSYILWNEEREEGKTYAEKYFYQRPDGNTQEFELGIEDYHTNLVSATFSADGRLFATTASSNVYEINLEKQSAKKLFAMDVDFDGSMCTNKDSLIVTDGEKVYFYNFKSKEMTAEDEILNGYVKKQTNTKYGTAICSAKNGKDNKTLYLAGCNGIAGHVIGGSVMEQLADGALTNLGDPSRRPNTMLQNKDGSFLILYYDGEMDSYVYDDKASAVPEQQITLYSLYDNETVRQAVSMFRKKSSEVFVRFEIGLSGENGMTESDAINNLNTELLAGEGPDMILLDGIPMDSYKEKGMLVDLSDMAADLEDTDTYFEHILKGYEQEDGIYALPFRFEVPIISGETSIIENVSDLKTLADQAEQLADLPTTRETVLGNYSPEDVLQKLFLTSANAWITDEGSVDKAALTEFLTQAKRIYEADQKNLNTDEIAEHKEEVEQFRKRFQDDEEVAKLYMRVRSMQQLTGRQVLSAGSLTSMSDFMELTSSNDKLGGRNYQILNGQDTNLFYPTGVIGISTNSRQQELAKDFIRTLFGKEVQGLDLKDGFPVNADAYKAFTTNPHPDSSMCAGGEDKDGNTFIMDYVWPDKQEIKQLEAILNTLKTPANTDRTLKNEVLTIGAQTLTGEKGVEQSVEEITQKISLHLQE